MLPCGRTSQTRPRVRLQGTVGAALRVLSWPGRHTARLCHTTSVDADASLPRLEGRALGPHNPLGGVAETSVAFFSVAMHCASLTKPIPNGDAARQLRASGFLLIHPWNPHGHPPATHEHSTRVCIRSPDVRVAAVRPAPQAVQGASGPLAAPRILLCFPGLLPLGGTVKSPSPPHRPTTVLSHPLSVQQLESSLFSGAGAPSVIKPGAPE